MNSDVILKWVSIVGGGLVIIGALWAFVEWRIGARVTDEFGAAKPASVLALETEVQLLRNDLGHFTGDLEDTSEELAALRTVIEKDLRCRAGGPCE